MILQTGEAFGPRKTKKGWRTADWVTFEGNLGQFQFMMKVLQEIDEKTVENFKIFTESIKEFQIVKSPRTSNIGISINGKYYLRRAK